jgi:hypothetical protein
MASTATCDMNALSEENMNTGVSCGCANELNEDTHFFRGIMIAIPAGLLAWAGLLRVVGEVIHRL